MYLKYVLNCLHLTKSNCSCICIWNVKYFCI